MIFDWPTLSAAFLLGLFSSAHCVGMCGGIMAALSMAVPAQAKSRRGWILLSYNLGRIASYSFMGLLVGLFAAQLAAWGAAVWLRWLAGLLLIAMGLDLANWWRGLTYLEAGGRYLWAYLQPLGKALMPVDSAAKALALGLIWGWLPCGLVYSALAYAMAQGQGGAAALAMLAFGLGTLPAVLATGLVAQQLGRWLQRPQVRWPLALAIVVFGLWTLWGGGYGDHSQHGHNHSAHQSDSQPHDEHQHHQHHNHQHHNHSQAQPAASSSSSAAVESGHGHHHHQQE